VVTIKSTVFFYVITWSHQKFNDISRICSGSKTKLVSNQQDGSCRSVCLLFASCWLVAWLTLHLEIRDTILWNVSERLLTTQHHITEDSNFHYHLCLQLDSIGNGEGNESEFQGPVKNRRCTDVFFLIIMLLFIISLVSDCQVIWHFWCKIQSDYVTCMEYDYIWILDWWLDLLDTLLQHVTTLYSSLLHTHTHKHAHTHTQQCPLSCLHCHCLVATSNGRHYPSSGFPNCPQLQLTALKAEINSLSVQ
jgi:hypothetical protein